MTSTLTHFVASAALCVGAITLAGCAPAYTSGPGGGGGGGGVQAAGERAETLPGTYRCTVERGEEAATPESCTISEQGGGLSLETSGAAPLRGTLTPTDAGFRFRGELQCADPGCPAAIETDFFADEGTADSYSGIAVLDGGGLLRIQIHKQ